MSLILASNSRKKIPPMARRRKVKLLQIYSEGNESCLAHSSTLQRKCGTLACYVYVCMYVISYYLFHVFVLILGQDGVSFSIIYISELEEASSFCFFMFWGRCCLLKHIFTYRPPRAPSSLHYTKGDRCVEVELGVFHLRVPVD